VKQIRKRLTYANVMSSIAVFLILGGATAFAATKIGSGQLKSNSVLTGKIKKEAVTSSKIKNAAIGSTKLADGAVTTSKIADLNVTNSKLGNASVTGEKIAAGAVSRADIAGANFIPRAYGLVDSNGTVEANLTSGLPNATHPSTGLYCFTLPFSPVHAQATGQADGESNDIPSVNIAGAKEGIFGCPAGTNVQVEVWETESDEPTSEEFFLVVW
jgi:hypothetical protein